MRNAVAFANNDVVTIAWSYGTKPEDCMGFALYRIDSKGEETASMNLAFLRAGLLCSGRYSHPFYRPRAVHTHTPETVTSFVVSIGSDGIESDGDLQPRSHFNAACLAGAQRHEQKQTSVDDRRPGKSAAERFRG